MANDPRPIALVTQAHPELDSKTAERVADALGGVAEGYGTDVSTLVAETKRAEDTPTP
jgi:hypothetical protein